jgi:transcriptional regulator with XRE-family HTH domain
MNRHRIGMKIQTIREWRNYTQTYMAERLGVRQNTYSMWEQGRGLNEDRVEEIARILEVPVSDLMSPEPLRISTGAPQDKRTAEAAVDTTEIVPLHVLERMLMEDRERVRVLEGLVMKQLELLQRFIDRST